MAKLPMLRRWWSPLMLIQPTSSSVRLLHDRSHVPRIVDDRTKKRVHKVVTYGYDFNYHLNGVQRLPRLKDNKVPVRKPEVKEKDAWRDDRAFFGQNDYIDLLGDGSVHPAQLMYHVPRWLRGFPGQHRANELVKLIHYRNLYKQQMQQHTPKRWHDLCKRIQYLLHHHNYKKADELHSERNLGLWDEEPDYFFKDKSRRSYKDLV
uniref:Large ribosomal subunit protein mL51 n=1 Tax=Plectus sambesii TaxID=2011161 RepID=A0A914WDK5_9BILA